MTAEATDDVDAFNPAIELTKLVNGRAGGHPHRRRARSKYTYAVTNAGNTPLGTVELTDDTAPCSDRRT